MTKPIVLYNTLSRQKEEFKSIEAGKVSMYTCGPTVYHFQHIGNMRSYIFADTLRRALTWAGYEVNQVMNITDVGHLVNDEDDTGEDKMEVGSRREGLSAWDIAKRYEAQFFHDIDRLNIKRAEIICRATDHISEQIEMVKTLEKNGFTYQIADGIYFDTSKLKDYGKLAKLDIAGLNAGERVALGDKKHKTDFALWKFSLSGEQRQMEWDSPWGPGFPGWHIECSAMSIKYLGDHFDIHTGGIDHIPIHHTNEIAQDEAFCGHKVVNYWLHGEHLILKDEKMSKSKGHILTLDNTIIANDFWPAHFRLMCLGAHYRHTLTFTLEALESAKNAYESLRHKMVEWHDTEKKYKVITPAMGEYLARFEAALLDDLNTAVALSVLWEALRDENLLASERYTLMDRFDEALGLGLMDLRRVIPTAEQQKLLLEREAARQQKDFARADEIRGQLEKEGIIIKDTLEGQKII